jgi:hypothetical protein
MRDKLPPFLPDLNHELDLHGPNILAGAHADNASFVAIRQGCTDSEAEDVVQETVIALAKKMSEYHCRVQRERHLPCLGA